VDDTARPLAGRLAVDGMSIERIARRLGCSPSTVSSC
jgi:uncharacterized protein YjcR